MKNKLTYRTPFLLQLLCPIIQAHVTPVHVGFTKSIDYMMINQMWNQPYNFHVHHMYGIFCYNSYTCILCIFETFGLCGQLLGYCKLG
jgi:hypothetical protein